MKTYKVTVNSTNTNRWYNHDDKLHREGGPAIEFGDGSKEWWISGERHREDGPAIIHSDGHKEWFINGLRHREDGPAIEYTNGGIAYFLRGVILTEEEFRTSEPDCTKQTITIEGRDYILTPV